MLLQFLNERKKLPNILFVSFILPYFLLCITLGGFHEGIFNHKHCTHVNQTETESRNCPNGLQAGVVNDPSKHDTETCQICQWLKTPSTTGQMLADNTPFDCIYIRPARYSNPLISPLSIHRFTIRPPPFFSCFSA